MHRLKLKKKKRTKPNYVDKQWDINGSDSVTVQEMHAYFGTCVILSVAPSRQLQHVFSCDPYINNTGLRNVFTLCRYSKISHYFCCSDKSVEPPKDSNMYDKLFKIRPVVETMQKLFSKVLVIWFQHLHWRVLSQMKSKNSVKHFLPNKPNKWGWKIWSCCDSDSPNRPYLLSFIPVLGGRNTQLFPKMVFSLMLYRNWPNPCVDPMWGCTQTYTDSAYSSIKTFLYLKKHSIFASGTCWQNILGLHPSVKNAPKRMPWGSQRIFQDQNDRFLTCCLWFDTKPVRFISTEVDPTVTCGALRRVGGQYERVFQPSVASKYAERYKSINLFDFSAQKYAIMRRSYRPWRYLFSFCFQAAIINAYILYMETSKLPRPKNFTQSDFRLLLGKQLIDGFSVCKYEPKVEPIFVGPGNPNTTIKNHKKYQNAFCPW